MFFCRRQTFVWRWQYIGFRAMVVYTCLLGVLLLRVFFPVNPADLLLRLKSNSLHGIAIMNADGDSEVNPKRLSLLLRDQTTENRTTLNVSNEFESSKLVLPLNLRKKLPSLHDETVKNNSSIERGRQILKSTDVNPHSFRYLINCEKLCNETAAADHLFLVVYVHSALDHYKHRTIIRETWGAVGQYDRKVRVVFVTGKPAETGGVQGLQNALQLEADRFGDIVQADFVDSYRNLTYKGLVGLKWIADFCPHSEFVLKTDDDIFINMFNLLRHLAKLEALGKNRGLLLLCLAWNMNVMRTGKWAVSRAEWKNEFYPQCCSGSAFVMSTDLAVALHEVSYSVPFFWIDDVYVTGILPMRLGNVTYEQFAESYLLQNGGPQFEERFTGPQWHKYVFAHVSRNLDAVQSVWKKVVTIDQQKQIGTEN